MRDLFAREALAQIPKILTLQDRDPHSPTYGCFDRNFWHYKIIDFPSGMSQEFVWPLALAYGCDLPGNRYFQCETLRDWIAAGIRYAARSAHADGSCDDYFPFEKAGGAAAFSLLACLESYALLGLDDEEMRTFFRKRTSWMAPHHESGRLTNHQALIALCLERAGKILGTTEWNAARETRINTVLSWQNPEGWFQEYEGCDTGYHTLTIGLLAELNRIRPDARIGEALERAVRFVAEFVHADGSFGGEYTSRNTYNFFPHGFEMVGSWLPEALAVNDRFARGLEAGLAPCYADDHIIGHHTWSYLLAWREWRSERPTVPARKTGRQWYEQSRLLIERRGGAELYLALNKGGVFRFFRDGKLIASDTQISLRLRGPKKIRTAVAHLVDDYAVELGEDQVTIRGSLGWAKHKQMTSLNLLILRGVMLSVGRFNPDLIRKLLQKMLITGKQAAPAGFQRTIRWEGDKLIVEDEVNADDWPAVLDAGIGSSQTSIYVVMSRTYQPGQLQGWHDLTPQVRKLGPSEPLRVRREF